jgi:hypothetical protein
MPPVVISISEALVDLLAEQVATVLAERIVARLPSPSDDGYLAPAAAAEYLGVSRKRIYDLRSARSLRPDGYDGRTPLFTRATLDAYVCGHGGREE